MIVTVRFSCFIWVQSANHVRTELPIRLAHRLRDMQSLPYIVVTQDQVAKVYEVRHDLQLSARYSCNAQLYWKAFDKCVSALRGFK